MHPAPPTEQTTQPEPQAISFTIIPTKDETRSAAEQARSQSKQVLFYPLQDGHSYLAIWLPNTDAVGQSGRGEWAEHRFFQPEQKDKAEALAKALRGLLPFEWVSIYQTKRCYWGVYVNLSSYWQALQEIHPRYDPRPTPYSRVLTPETLLQLPLWYAEARRTGYQTLTFKAGKHYQVVHVPKDLDLGEQGKQPWDTRFFFEAGVKAEHFAQCLRLVEGIKDAVVNAYRSRGVPRRHLWLVSVKPVKVP